MDSEEKNFDEFTSIIHKDTLADNLNEYRKIGKYCDVILNLPDGSSFKVHKIIIISGSEYFRGLVEFDDEKITKDDDSSENSYSVASTNNKRLKLDEKSAEDESIHNQNSSIRNIDLDYEISKDNFEKIIEFIYTGNIVVTTDCALSLYQNAEFFSLLVLKTILTTFMLRNLDLSTALEYWRVSKFNPELNSHCTKFIHMNCDMFLKTNLSDLTFNEINKITKWENINCSEKDVFMNILNWVNFNWTEREQDLRHLLDNIRFISLNDENIFELVYNTLDKFLKSDSNNLKVLRELVDHAKVKKSNFIKNINKASYSPRIGLRGKAWFTITNTGIYNIKKSDNPPINHSHGEGVRCTAFAKNYLLLSGGKLNSSDSTVVETLSKKAGNEISKLCSYYCPIINKFESFPSMHFPRSNHGLITINNMIYACGGTVNSSSLEMFDYDASTWIQGPTMNEGRSDFGIVASDNCLYVIGGVSDEVKNGRRGTIERFDHRENKWNKIIDLPEKFSGMSTDSFKINDSQIISYTSHDYYVFELRAGRIENISIDYPRKLNHTTRTKIYYHNKKIFHFEYEYQNCKVVGGYYCLDTKSSCKNRFILNLEPNLNINGIVLLYQ